MNKILERFRVKDWYYYLGYVLFGSLISKNLNWINFLIGSFMLAYAYSFNDYYDKRLGSKWFLFPLLLSFIFLPFLNKLQFIFYALFILIFTLYSWPKTYFEGKPVISLFCNAIGFLLLFFLPFTEIKTILVFFNFTLLLFLLNIAAQTIHEIVDYGEDKRIGKSTTTVRFGIPFSTSMLRFFLIAILFLSLTLLPNLKFIFLSTLIFSSYFFVLSIREEINYTFRKKFKYFGIVSGIIYLLDLVK